jgi:serine/threonine-protein kinase RsbW
VTKATTIRVPAAGSGVERARAALDGFCAEHKIPAAEAWRLKVSLDEALSNVVRHGQADPGSDVAIGMRVDAGAVELTVSDGGPAFNPLDAAAPDRAAGLEARTPGGLGIVLVRALMDEVEYARRDNLNVLTLRKRL